MSLALSSLGSSGDDSFCSQSKRKVCGYDHNLQQLRKPCRRYWVLLLTKGHVSLMKVRGCIITFSTCESPALDLFPH